MPGFRLHTSNRLETLADRLGDTVAASPLPALTYETIVVQSKGMERWISMRLARRFGVWARCRYPFPNAIVDETLRSFLGQPSGGEGLLEPSALLWRVVRHLAAAASGGGAIAQYLSDDCAGSKRLQLAARVADLLDQYTVFRPAMISGWERGISGAGDDERWQALLWRLIVNDTGPCHRAELLRRLGLEANLSIPASLPPRLCIFGISHLPQFHLTVLGVLARHTDVHLFVLDPCKEYWRDIRAENDIVKLRAAAPGAELHYETGNSLLAAWAGQGRGFFSMLDGMEGLEDVTDRAADYIDPGESSMLACVQSDILNLRQREHPDPGSRVHPNDRSIQVHSCHCPLR